MSTVPLASTVNPKVSQEDSDESEDEEAVSYTNQTLPTTPYV
jgi:hypothetical protein